MPGRKTHTRNLHRRLRAYQKEDIDLPPPTVLEIKYYLRRGSQVPQIQIQDPSDDPSFDSDSTSFQNLLMENELHPSLLPKFMTSQMRAQKIAYADCPNYQVSAAIAVAFERFARYPWDTFNNPHLFTWQSSNRKRSYCLFAFLNASMDSRTYSAKELLELRGAVSPHSLLNEIKLNPDLSEIIKGKGALPPPQPRRLRKTKEDSSTDSEDHVLLFKGKKPVPSPTSVLQASSDGTGIWRYRGRSGSELASTEPLTAPNDLIAQRNEGFQRFFKAVVSPTHVRVTAGGRIVPNNRASSSPTAKWDKERMASDSQDPAEAKKQGKVDMPNPAAGHMGHHPMMSPMFPGHPAFYQHMGLPMPLVPMHGAMGMPYGFPYPMVPSERPFQASYQAPDDSGKVAGEPQVTNNDEASGNRKTRPSPIKVSPPEQFDQNRPFFYNGQVIYPSGAVGQVPNSAPGMMHGHYCPPGMVPHPGFASARFGPGLPYPQMQQTISPNMAPAPFSATSPVGGGQHPQDPMSAKTQTTPPVTSIKPSEITKRQLSVLRNSLKYYEDQLLYNKHQIDEKLTQDQVKKISDNIREFEDNYQMQASFEGNYCQQSGASSASTTTTVSQEPSQVTARGKTPRRIVSNVKEHRSEETPRSATLKVESHGHFLRAPQSMDQIRARSRDGFRNRSAIGLNSSKGSSQSSAALDVLEAHITSQLDTDDAKNSGLTTKAALAPAFQPASNSTEPTTGPQWPANEAYQYDTNKTWDAAPAAAQYNPASSAMTHVPAGFTTPYLVGQLPEGVNMYGGRHPEYEYSRELTEEEKRARHVYWGGVPTKGTGLPKFDGKDFYPPSPTKNYQQDKSGVNTARQIPVVVEEFDFDMKPKAAEPDPFLPTRGGSSIRSKDSGHKISKAIPIVAPDSVGRDKHGKKPTASQEKSVIGGAEVSESSKHAPASKSPDQDKASIKRSSDASSCKTDNKLWQTMLRKGSTSGSAVPSAVSSTTATGYLPQYAGHAAASLSPAIMNTINPTGRSSMGGESKLMELENNGAGQAAADKVDENCPPGERVR